jgi:hemerythrin superfamily protein
MVIAATRHEAAEELQLWPLVRERLPGGVEMADAAGEQELEQRKLLQRLDSRRPGDVDFDELVSEFAHRAASHIAYEETMVWPALRQTLGRRERQELGHQIVKAKRTAPTRPHQSVPASPGRHRLLGRSLAALDRNLDRITARGR